MEWWTSLQNAQNNSPWDYPVSESLLARRPGLSEEEEEEEGISWCRVLSMDYSCTLDGRLMKLIKQERQVAWAKRCIFLHLLIPFKQQFTWWKRVKNNNSWWWRMHNSINIHLTWSRRDLSINFGPGSHQIMAINNTNQDSIIGILVHREND